MGWQLLVNHHHISLPPINVMPVMHRVLRHGHLCSQLTLITRKLSEHVSVAMMVLLHQVKALIILPPPMYATLVMIRDPRLGHQSSQLTLITRKSLETRGNAPGFAFLAAEVRRP